MKIWSGFFIEAESEKKLILHPCIFYFHYSAETHSNPSFRIPPPPPQNCILKLKSVAKLKILFSSLSLCRFTFSLYQYLLSFCLQPSAKDQGITWVVVVLVLFHLYHSFIKRNLSEKNYHWPGFEMGSWGAPVKNSINCATAILFHNTRKIIYFSPEFQNPRHRPLTSPGSSSLSFSLSLSPFLSLSVSLSFHLSLSLPLTISIYSLSHFLQPSLIISLSLSPAASLSSTFPCLSDLIFISLVAGWS